MRSAACLLSIFKAPSLLLRDATGGRRSESDSSPLAARDALNPPSGATGHCRPAGIPSRARPAGGWGLYGQFFVFVFFKFYQIKEEGQQCNTWVKLVWVMFDAGYTLNGASLRTFVKHILNINLIKQFSADCNLLSPLLVMLSKDI